MNAKKDLKVRDEVEKIKFKDYDVMAEQKNPQCREIERYYRVDVSKRKEWETRGQGLLTRPEIFPAGYILGMWKEKEREEHE